MNIDPNTSPLARLGDQQRSLQNYSGVAQGSSYGDPFSTQAEENFFDPVRILLYLVHHRWIILACLTTGLVLGTIYTWMQTPMYRAGNTIEVGSTSNIRVLQDLELVRPDSPFVAIETARQKIQSRDIARRVVFDLNLTENDVFLAPTPQFSLSNITRRIFGTRTSDKISGLSAEQREVLATSKVVGGLSTSAIPKTRLMSVRYSHPNPELAAAVVNQISESYIDQSVDKKSTSSDLARQFIQEQVIETKRKLEESERALVDYAQREGITLSGDNASLIVSNVAAINASLSETIQERLALERYVALVDEGGASTLPAVFESASIQGAKQSISALKATYQEKLATLKPGFPEMRRIQAQIDELENQMNIEIAAIGRSMKARYEQNVAKEKSLRDELAKLDDEQVEFQRKNIQYTILKREVDSNRSQYDSFINRLNNVDVGSSIKSPAATLIDGAVVPTRPYSPRLSGTLIKFLLLFSTIAAAIIYVIEMLNNRFSVPDQIEAELKLPVLGVVPRLTAADLPNAMNDNASPLSEAFRTLRTSLQFTGIEEAGKVLMVTSSEPSEGKSTTAFKLAKEFAALGRSVLVIDADMRRPSLHRLFKTDNGLGLSNLLTNVVSGRSDTPVFRTTDIPGIAFLSSGTIPPNPVDLLASERMGLMLHFCAKKYDLIIVDSAPVMGLADAPILSRHSDAVLFIVSCNGVTRKSASHALRRLKSSGAHVVGASFNGFQVNKIDQNFAYRHLQYNYYNYSTDVKQIAANDSTNATAHHDEGLTSGEAGANWLSRLHTRFARRSA